jgi:hypothetical protein
MKTKPGFDAGDFIFVLMFFFAFHSVSFAETIYLRDGRVRKEKIVERKPHYIVTMDGKVPHKYFTGQIERIEEDGPQHKAGIADINTSPFEGISQEKVKLILGLIEASGVRRSMEQNFEQVIAQAEEEKRVKFKELFNVHEIIERLVPLYDKYYGEEDLREIIRFYESPAGRKILEVTPQIMKESVEVSIQYLQGKVSP